MDDQEYVNVRAWKQTHKKLRIIAAHKDEKIVETLDRLVTEELRRIGVKTEDTKTDKLDQD
jgi:hypothetical protein